MSFAEHSKSSHSLPVKIGGLSSSLFLRDGECFQLTPKQRVAFMCDFLVELYEAVVVIDQRLWQVGTGLVKNLFNGRQIEIELGVQSALNLLDVIAEPIQLLVEFRDPLL